MDRVLISQGQVALARHEPRQAASLFAESLTLSRMPSDRRTIARCLVGLVASATLTAGMDDGQQTVALVRLHSASTTLFPQLDADLTPRERPAIETALGLLRQRLDSDAFEAAQADGRMLTMGQSIDLGLDVARQVQTASTESVSRPAAGLTARGRRPSQPVNPADLLTPRESEVAALIVQGRTNREIAAALVLSERTVDGHIRNIMGKLETSSRARIAAWAVRHGLGDDA
jgi:DNA-binding CsgD family transcriptional regulator